MFLSSSKECAEVGYQFGLYSGDPDDQRVRLCGDVFSDSARDRRVMGMVLKKYRRWSARQTEPKMCLGVFQVVFRDEVRDIKPPLDLAKLRSAS